MPSERAKRERQLFEHAIRNGHSCFREMDIEEAWETWIICLVTHSGENEPTGDLMNSVLWDKANDPLQ
jgi:hypothetical protein